MISAVDILKDLKSKQIANLKSFAILIDPDKTEVNTILKLLQTIPECTDYIFVGGSQVESGKTEEVVKEIKKLSPLPVVLFPGNINQITRYADALLFLSLMSGSNPEYLIHQQVKSVKHLRHTNLEIIPTGYILIDGGKTCTTERITNTKAISQADIDLIVDTCLVAQYTGKRLIYLEAGSGANFPVKPEIIRAVKTKVELPIIVGGGIKTEKQREMAYKAGADVVVMGTVFEDI
ncbi:geranylgeranylglyceryl/heptaprenylglyceryl phosphate synthase [Flavobacterium sp. CS20]|uniref:geranylgeranylglyceryl/heptaprenylglyceryl phosphate synthase n=1 Tax=Flavobacterium sp. CS20 TaxID=2775246 RepID=UPI001B39EFD6|nr:geranylgeranylglyceryl/heptaprenylglyceryl phosphate synthase [Flavobacterium sp. CS20]QTY26036.1 geranylgeranylglyceryl/heptaprenylglyceryl phosphate synthase [Flavobacterium sp. CS20]